IEGRNNRYTLNADGSFSTSIPLCSSTVSADITAQDIDALQGSNPVTVNLVNGNNAIGTLQACNNSISEFINYTVNGNPQSFTYPADNFYHNVYNYSIPYDAISASGNSPSYRYLNMSFSHQGISA